MDEEWRVTWMALECKSVTEQLVELESAGGVGRDGQDERTPVASSGARLDGFPGWARSAAPMRVEERRPDVRDRSLGCAGRHRRTRSWHPSRASSCRFVVRERRGAAGAAAVG